jgi:cation diffusion facilitator CzcD-associated flavoprotein CzcO
MTATPSVLELDVLVIGAGQAGLATGYYVRRTGLRYELLDGNSGVGDSWRQRFDSLMLFTPRSYSPGPGDGVRVGPGRSSLACERRLGQGKRLASMRAQATRRLTAHPWQSGCEKRLFR